jgi:phosphoribosylglycinamide formyltransferase 1
MNFAFYVSGRASRLRRLLEEDGGAVLADTKLVVSDSEVNRDLAAPLDRRGIKFVCGDYSDFGNNAAERSRHLSHLLLREFRALGIDYCFCFGVHILRGELLEVYHQRIINFHPSILPAFPGLNAIDKAIAAGAVVLGNTAHFMSEEVDGGPYVLQSVVSVEVFKTGGYEAILGLQNTMLQQIATWLRAGRLTVQNGRVKVAGAAPGAASFYPALD